MDRKKSITQINKNYIDTARALATKADENGYKVKSLYIFGSRVSGKSTKWSDLDVCLVSPNVSENLFDERVRFSIIGHEVSDSLEVHPMSPYDFNNKYNLLAREVKRTGVRII